jgi:hypothetical protein
VHVSRLTAALAIAAAVAAPSTAAAPGAFRGNVCSLATAKQVTAIPDVYTDSGMLQRAGSNLNEGLVGSRPKKIAGVGSAAYEATGAGKTEIQFASGKYIARVTVTTTGKRSRVALETLAKAIAKKL